MNLETELAETLSEIQKWAKRELVWRPLPPLDRAALKQGFDQKTMDNMIATAIPAAGLTMAVVRGAPAAVAPAVGRVLTSGKWAKVCQLFGNRALGGRGARHWLEIMLDGQPHLVKLLKTSTGHTSIHIEHAAAGLSSKNAAALVDDIAAELAKAGPVERFVAH